MFSNNRFTPAARRSRTAQVEELINTARVSVFFIDDLQVVRPGEIGSSSLIRDAAEAQGVPFYEFELDAQFRCNGSEAFINWVDNTLRGRPLAVAHHRRLGRLQHLVSVVDPPRYSMEGADRCSSDGGRVAARSSHICQRHRRPRQGARAAHRPAPSPGCSTRARVSIEA